MVSDDRIIQLELVVGVSLFGLFLSYLGVYASSSWNTLVTLLLAWIIADGFAAILEGRIEGRFKVPLSRNKFLPFPHRITVAYFLYPIGILIAIFYGEVLTAILLQGLTSLQQSSFLAVFSLSTAQRQEQYVFSVSFIVSILLYRDFMWRTQTEEHEDEPKNN